MVLSRRVRPIVRLRRTQRISRILNSRRKGGMSPQQKQSKRASEIRKARGWAAARLAWWGMLRVCSVGYSWCTRLVTVVVRHQSPPNQPTSCPLFFRTAVATAGTETYV